MSMIWRHGINICHGGSAEPTLAELLFKGLHRYHWGEGTFQTMRMTKNQEHSNNVFSKMKFNMQQ